MKCLTIQQMLLVYFSWTPILLHSTVVNSTIDFSSSRPLGRLEMELISGSSPSPSDDVENSNWIYELLSITAVFLDNYMYVYFAEDNEIDFLKPSLSVENYETISKMPSNGNSSEEFIASINLSGLVYFTSYKIPDQDTITTAINSAFINENSNFLNGLWTQSSNPFVREVKSVRVKVIGAESNFTYESNNEGSENNTADTAERGQHEKLDLWVVGLISGGAAFCFLIIVCVTCVCLTPIDDLDINPQPPKKSETGITRTSRDEDESSADKESEINISTNFGTNAMQSPSTVHSITSQDSSIFTYNPISGRSFASNGSKTFGSGFFTANSGLEMDLQTWQNGGSVIKDETQGPFGQDISAISNKKDLSLIEEDDMSQKLSGKSTLQYFQAAGSSSSTPKQYLTESAVQDLELNDRWGNRAKNSISLKSVSSNVSSKFQKKYVASTRHSISSLRSGCSSSINGNSRSDLDGSGTDIIKDLRDLSYQIDKYRTRTMND